MEAGPDGFVAAVNAANPGEIRITGLYLAADKGPGTDLHLLTIHWTAVGVGEATVDLSVGALTDPTTEEIEIPQGHGGQVTVNMPKMTVDVVHTAQTLQETATVLAAVPEPSALILVGLGLLGLLEWMRRTCK